MPNLRKRPMVFHRLRFDRMRNLLGGLALATIASSVVQSAPMIVEDGKPNAQIVIAAENRPRMTTLAALELQRGIEKLSGAHLPIVTVPDDSVPVKIYVGDSPGAAELGVTSKGLVEEGAFRIASGEDWIALVGNDNDFVPGKLTKTSRDDQGPAEEWKRVSAGKSKGAWLPPTGGEYKFIWRPDDFAKVLADYYGKDAHGLWKSGGNTLDSFWYFDESGSVSAVTRFLYRLGVRFYMPIELGEVYPNLATIPLPEINETFIPDFPCRFWPYYNYGAFPLEQLLWGRRLGMNSGAGHKTGVHGLVRVHGSEETHKAHPEFFAIQGGKKNMKGRHGEGVPCFNSDEFIQETINYSRFCFDVVGEKVVDIMPGDGLHPTLCECDKCKGKTASELVWGFVNRVATELYKTHPENLVKCSAYSHYIPAPDAIEKFTPNVVVAIYSNTRPAFNDPEIWDAYRANVEKWVAKLAPSRLMRGDNNLYNGSANRTTLITFPIIFPRAMARDMVFLKGKSLGETAEVPQNPGRWKSPGVDHLALYVQATFLMDADQDINQVLAEYYKLFYGPAAEEMKEAFTYMEDNMATRDTSGPNGRKVLMNVPYETNIHLRELLAKAHKKAGDSIYGKRIETILSELNSMEQVKAEESAKKHLQSKVQTDIPLVIAVKGEDLTKSKSYPLSDIKTGKPPKHPTKFQAAWDKNDLLLEITCSEPDLANVVNAAPITDGDYIVVGLKPNPPSGIQMAAKPRNSYYLLSISPEGKILDGNPGIDKWSSQVQVETSKGEDSWTVKLRIPTEDVDHADNASAVPNTKVAGRAPGMHVTSRWAIQVGRNRVRGDQVETSSLWPAASKDEDWHSYKRYGQMVVEGL